MMHLRRIDSALPSAETLEISESRTLGRVDFRLRDEEGKPLMIVSREHVELRPASNGTCTVKALHSNAVRILQGGEAHGTLLAADGSERQEATLRPGDLLEVGDVRGLHPRQRLTVAFRLCLGSAQSASLAPPTAASVSVAAVRPPVAALQGARTPVTGPGGSGDDAGPPFCTGTG